MDYESEKVDHLHDGFWVIAVLNNPCRYKRRIQLFFEFIERMKNYGVNICVVEVAYGERKFETAKLEVGVKVNLRTKTVLWQKENMINIGISRLPRDWKYVAWIDADIDFTRKDWVKETIHQLQMHSVVQLFQDVIDMGPDGEIMKTASSFMYCYKNDIPRSVKMGGKSGEYSYDQPYNKGSYWHPGYAWAATRRAIETVGHLFELGILGAGDHHMACALIGECELSLQEKLSDDYKLQLINWEKRALKLKKNVGYVKGSIYHYWHGKKSDRRYGDRWQVLVENNYQPTHDVYRDWQGLLVFHEGNYQLRDAILRYFQSRNEDSIDLV